MTPVEVTFVSALLFSLALNGILIVVAARLLADLTDARYEVWQMHLERLLPDSLHERPWDAHLESGEVVKQPRTEARMSGLRTEGNVVFLNNTEQSVV
jgi:hypothetical protein